MRMITVALVTLSVVACSSTYQDPSPTTDSNVKSGSSSGSGGKSDGSDPSKGADPGADPSGGKGSDPGADPSGKGSDPSADADGGKPGADPTCLATCAMTMVTKCGGDTTVCDDVCSLTPTEIACLEAAPTCDKSVWVMCLSDQDAGAAPAKGGGK